jgi:hypothetical protein
MGQMVQGMSQLMIDLIKRCDLEPSKHYTVICSQFPGNCEQAKPLSQIPALTTVHVSTAISE